MAETTPTPTPNEEPQAAPAKKSTLVVRIGVVLFLAVVVLAEVLVAYKFISGSGGNSVAAATSEEETAKSEGEESVKEPKEGKHKEPGAKESESSGKHSESKAGEHGAKKSEAGEHGKKAVKKEHGALPGDEAASEAEQSEVELGKFTVTGHQSASNTTVRIDFRLYGIVAAEYKEDLEKVLKANQNRFREQVLVIVRSAEPTDLAEAGLGLIKRQILEKTNGLLGKPLIRSVIITDFSHIEQ